MRNMAIAVLLLFCMVETSGAICVQFEVTEDYVQRLLTDADAVFVGSLIAGDDLVELEPPERMPPQASEWTTHVVLHRFSVERWWKGTMGSEEQLFTGDYRTNTGRRRVEDEALEPVLGGKYLIVAFRGRHPNPQVVNLELLNTSRCNGWEVSSDTAAAHLDLLGPGQPPRDR